MLQDFVPSSNPTRRTLFTSGLFMASDTNSSTMQIHDKTFTQNVHRSDLVMTTHEISVRYCPSLTGRLR